MTSSAEQIDHLLQYIGADDYQNWIKVGMGLKSEFGDSGLQLWDKWSQSSEKYNAAEIPKNGKASAMVGLLLAPSFIWRKNRALVSRHRFLEGANLCSAA